MLAALFLGLSSLLVRGRGVTVSRLWLQTGQTGSVSSSLSALLGDLESPDSLSTPERECRARNILPVTHLSLPLPALAVRAGLRKVLILTEVKANSDITLIILIEFVEISKLSDHL